jgi:DNA-binding PadR family transcriptional regulator
MSNNQPENKKGLNLELRRGAIVLAVLSQLKDEHYGYSLKRVLQDKGLVVDEGTLYPMMRRLEAQGLLASEWRIEEGRPRRYYRLSDSGRTVLTDMGRDWDELTSVMKEVLR